MYLHRFIPLLEWTRSYNSDHLKGDVNAGLIVGVMLIPQGMAYAVLAGMPPVYGLYASTVPLILYAIFGTSRQLAVGPVAIISLLVVAGVGELAVPGSDRFIQLVIITALGVGIVQFLMGVFRMGFLVNFISHPVLSGFTSAAALIIATSQIPGLLGLDLPRSHYVYEVLLAATQKLNEINLMTSVIGVGSIGAIILIRKWKRTFPASLTMVIAGTLVTAIWGLHDSGVAVVGKIPAGLPSPALSGFNPADLMLLLPVILVIAFVGYMESIAVAKAIANKRGDKIDANQELIALGSANLGGALFQAFPVAGGFSRTAVNDRSGARSGMASLFSAGIVMLTVLFLTPYFYYLPNAVLAAIIIVAVTTLFDHNVMVELWKTDKRDLAMLLVTFFATLGLGIEEGISVGVVLSLAVVVYSSTKPHSAELGRLGNTKNFRNVNRYPEAVTTEDVLIFRFDSSLYFANVEHFRDSLEELVEKKGEHLELVILDASAINSIDSTGIREMKELIRDLGIRRIRFYIAGAIGPVRDKLKASGIVEIMGEQNFFFDTSGAIDHFRLDREQKRDYEYSPLQSNF